MYIRNSMGETYDISLIGSAKKLADILSDSDYWFETCEPGVYEVYFGSNADYVQMVVADETDSDSD